MNIDVDALREDLITYFGLASRYYKPAIMDIIKLETASDEEVISVAIDNNFDLSKYNIDTVKTR